MAALFDDVSVRHEQYDVCVAYSRQTVRDHEARPAAHERVHRFAYLRLRPRIHAARGLVEDEHGRVAQEHACDRKQLPLTDGQGRSVAATAKTLGNDEPGRSVTTKKDRAEKGEQAQVDIFGEGMRGFASKGTMNRFLSANCFGDYYTRKGLPYSDRELITFCFLAAQGGCEPQLKSHAAANIRVGNGADKLTAVVLAVLPLIGYPRSLNALSCVAAAASGA